VSKNVVLLSTRRLAPAYFDTVRADLGDPEVTLDVIGWLAPDGWVADKVNSFTLIGPGRMPDAPTAEPLDEPKPQPAPEPTGTKRGVAGMLPKAIKTSAPVRFLRGSLAERKLGKAYWDRILSRRDVMSTIDKADVVVALDTAAVWAGWNLGQRKASTPVVLGTPAARRELDQLKAPAGNG
jgi:hypothetical protein